jgi:hypothetical protein
MGTPVLAEIGLPDFGEPGPRPEVPAESYAARLRTLRERARAHDHDFVVVYADREHSASLAWLTGFDPRFEEAVLVARTDDDGEPAILVGNECWGTAGAAPLPMRRHLYQDLSLQDQPRDRSRPLDAILADEGVGAGAMVGVIGWKPFADLSRLEVPSYLADELRALAGPGGRVENANALLVDPASGLRVRNDADQLAAFEHAACRVSSGVRRVIEGLRPGLREDEAVQLLGWDGTPLSCHLMLTAGPRARHGLLSPGERVIERGDPFTIAFGIWGALTCRAGFVVAGADELPSEVGDYVERLVAPYFGAVAEWYEALHVGQEAGVLQDIIDRRLGDPFFGIGLNPGHLLSLDEWVASPIHRGSQIRLASGMALQADIIPATGTPWFTTNIEDGLALADEPLRAELAARYPAMWARVQARRAFMADALGIRLHPDVLPFSNVPAYLPPYLLRPGLAMAMQG